MRIKEVTGSEDFNRGSRLSTLRLPHLSSPANLTGPRLQGNTAENTDQVSRDRSIPGERNESNLQKKNKSIMAKPPESSRQGNWNPRGPKFLPKTAERLSVVQRIYGVTVVPERVLFQNLRPQPERNVKKSLNPSREETFKRKGKAKAHIDEDNITTAEDIRTIEVDIPFVQEENISENNRSLTTNESSISLPNSADEGKRSIPARFPKLQKKRFTKTRKKETKGEEGKKEEENHPWNKKRRPKFVKKKKTHPGSENLTDFFLKLTRRPPPKHMMDPRYKDQERLVLNYYKRCQNFLLAEPKVDIVSKYCSNANNSTEGLKAKSDEESMANSKTEPSISNACVNADNDENCASSVKTLDDVQDTLQKQSLNSLEDFDAFIARSVMERVSKNKKRRARIKSMLKKEYARNCNDALNPSANEDSNSNLFNAESDEDCCLNHTAADEANNILSSCSSDDFSTFNDNPQPMINAIDNFDNFVAKAIKNHIYRQMLSHRKSKRKHAVTKFINSYDAWLHRRIFGYQSRKKAHENSNMSNLTKQKSSRRLKKLKSKSRGYTWTTTDSLFSNEGRKTRPERNFSKKILIDDVLKAMENIDNELTTKKTKKDHKDDSDAATSESGFSSRPSSLKMHVSRTDSLPLLNELQEKRAEALHNRIESMLTAPSIHRSYQIASAIPFKMPKKVFHFSDVDKCSKFEKMVQKYTGRDHVLLNSIKAMNDINLRLLNFHKEATDKHKELLRNRESKRHEILIREGVMERDYDDLEMKRQRQFLRKHYNPKRVTRNFTVNPMRNRYNMASKTLKVLDDLNVSKSFAELQNKKRKRVEKKKTVVDSKYSSMLDSDSSDKKELVDVVADNMSDYYDNAKSEVQSIYSSATILGYRTKKNLDLPQTVPTESTDSSSDYRISSSKGSKGIFEKFTKVETKKREKRERKEREKARKKLMEAKKAMKDEKNTESEMTTTVTSISTSTDKQIVHVHVSAGEPPPPPPTINETRELEIDDEMEKLPTITITRKLSDHNGDESYPKQTVVGLTKMIDAMIGNMDEETDYEMKSGKKKRLSRKSSQGYGLGKKREALDILKPLNERKRISKTSTKTFAAKKNRIRSMRPGMQISSSQPAPLPRSSAAQVTSPKNSKKLSPNQERQLSSAAPKKDPRSAAPDGTLVLENTSRFIDKSSIFHKSSLGRSLTASKEVPQTQHALKDKATLDRDFTDSRIFLEKAPTKTKKRDMRY